MIHSKTVPEILLLVEGERSADRFQGSFLDRYVEAYRRETHHFANMLDGADASVGHAYGLNAPTLAEAAAESVGTGASVRP